MADRTTAIPLPNWARSPPPHAVQAKGQADPVLARLPVLERVRRALRARHYSPRTEKAYLAWIRRYALQCGERHPEKLGAPEITQYLSSLAIGGRVSASTQNQAFSALLFLYRLCAAAHKRGYVAAPVTWRSGRKFLSVAGQ